MSQVRPGQPLVGWNSLVFDDKVTVLRWVFSSHVASSSTDRSFRGNILTLDSSNNGISHPWALAPENSAQQFAIANKEKTILLALSLEKSLRKNIRLSLKHNSAHKAIMFKSSSESKWSRDVKTTHLAGFESSEAYFFTIFFPASFWKSKQTKGTIKI